MQVLMMNDGRYEVHSKYVNNLVGKEGRIN